MFVFTQKLLLYVCHQKGNLLPGRCQNQDLRTPGQKPAGRAKSKPWWLALRLRSGATKRCTEPSVVGLRINSVVGQDKLRRSVETLRYISRKNTQIFRETGFFGVTPENVSRGFTLIELLVVILMIGILSAIALPTFLRLINQAKESEATQYISYLNKHQTAEYLEGSEFTNSFGTLSFPQPETPSSAAGLLKSLGFSVAETNNYLYGIKIASYNNNPLAIQVALSKQLGVKSYLGIVYFKDNKAPCGPVSLPVSLSSPPFQQFGILNNLISNPGSYCPDLF
jgi:prepilin-type N-terminal cleavage/methylation domain-containing protein